jgi:hypothetical protein
MAASVVIEDDISTLTSAPENLTEIGRESDLIEPEPERRPHQNEVNVHKDFEIDPKKLPNYIHKPPGPRGNTSWVFNYGPELLNTKTNKEYFLCLECWPKKTTLIPCAATTGVIRHLEARPHCKGPKLERDKQRREQNNVYEQLKKQSAANTSRSYPRERFEFHFLDWVTHDNIAQNQVSSPKFRTMMSEANPLILNYLRSGHDYLAKLYMNTVTRWRRHVRKEINNARSQIHITYDGWKSDNGIPMIGVVAHFVDRNLQLKTILLGLREIQGSHTGENIAEVIRIVLQDYRVSPETLGYYVLDNATKNDTCVESLANDFKFSAGERRLRCAGHVINLVAQAMLFGTDSEVYETLLAEADQEESPPRGKKRKHSEFEDELDNSTVKMPDLDAAKRKTLELDLKRWRKFGAVGKLHNIVVHARWNPERIKRFEAIQKTCGRTRVYQLRVDGGIRWNSTFEMIERGKPTYRIRRPGLANPQSAPPKEWHQLVLLRGERHQAQCR